jgi:hypothetical protein
MLWRKFISHNLKSLHRRLAQIKNKLNLSRVTPQLFTTVILINKVSYRNFSCFSYFRTKFYITGSNEILDKERTNRKRSSVPFACHKTLQNQTHSNKSRTLFEDSLSR